MIANPKPDLALFALFLAVIGIVAFVLLLAAAGDPKADDDEEGGDDAA